MLKVICNELWKPFILYIKKKQCKKENYNVTSELDNSFDKLRFESKQSGICDEKCKNKPPSISFDCYNISSYLNKKWMLRMKDKNSYVNIVNTVLMIGAKWLDIHLQFMREKSHINVRNAIIDSQWLQIWKGITHLFMKAQSLYRNRERNHFFGTEYDI